MLVSVSLVVLAFLQLVVADLLPISIKDMLFPEPPLQGGKPPSVPLTFIGGVVSAHRKKNNLLCCYNANPPPNNQTLRFSFLQPIADFSIGKFTFTIKRSLCFCDVFWYAFEKRYPTSKLYRHFRYWSARHLGCFQWGTKRIYFLLKLVLMAYFLFILLQCTQSDCANVPMSQKFNRSASTTNDAFDFRFDFSYLDGTRVVLRPELVCSCCQQFIILDKMKK